MVVAQPLVDDRPLFGAEAELLGAPTRITNRQYPDRVAFSVGADGTTSAMANDAAEQGAVSFRWACVNQEKLAMRLPVMPVAYGLSWIESSRAGSLVGFAKGRRVMAARAGGVGGCGRTVATLQHP